MGDSCILENHTFLEEADSIPFEGPEARYFRSSVIEDDGSQPYRKCKTIGDFIRKTSENIRVREMGYGHSKGKLDWFIYAPTEEIYSNAEYIPWRVQEEQTLGLTCIGEGTTCGEGWKNWTQNKSELAFGVFVNDILLGNNLHPWFKNSIKAYRKKVRGLSKSEQLQNNIISLRSAVELSLFVYISRDTKLSKLQTKYGSLILSTNRNEIKGEERKVLEQSIRLYTITTIDEIFSTEKYRINRGTKIILSTTSKEELISEIISSGPWSRSICYDLGEIKQSKVSKMMFETVLGREPISQECKQQIEKNALYLAQGGNIPKSRIESSIPFRHMNDWKHPGASSYPEKEEVKDVLLSKVFQIKNGKYSKQIQYVSINFLLKLKRENRKRIEIALALVINKNQLEYNLTHLKIRLDKMPKGHTPKSICRYPVELTDFQTPYKFYNNPINIDKLNGYDGYQARVNSLNNVFPNIPLEIPTLDCVEDQLTCVELPINKTETSENQTLLIQRYVEEKKKWESNFKGILLAGYGEEPDVWNCPQQKENLPLRCANFKKTFSEWECPSVSTSN